MLFVVEFRARVSAIVEVKEQYGPKNSATLSRTGCLFREAKGGSVCLHGWHSCRVGALQGSAGCAGRCRSRSLPMAIKSSRSSAIIVAPVCAALAESGDDELDPVMLHFIGLG
jgi:hypothetical protein